MTMQAIIGRKPKDENLSRAYALADDRSLIWLGQVRKQRIDCKRDLHTSPRSQHKGIYLITKNPEVFPETCFNLTKQETSEYVNQWKKCGN